MDKILSLIENIIQADKKPIKQKQSHKQFLYNIKKEIKDNSFIGSFAKLYITQFQVIY